MSYYSDLELKKPEPEPAPAPVVVDEDIWSLYDLLDMLKGAVDNTYTDYAREVVYRLNAGERVGMMYYYSYNNYHHATTNR